MEQRWVLCVVKQVDGYALRWVHESGETMIRACYRTFRSRSAARSHGGRRFAVPWRSIPALGRGAGRLTPERLAAAANEQAALRRSAIGGGPRRGDPNLSPMELLEERKKADYRTQCDALEGRIEQRDVDDIGDVVWVVE